MTDDKDIVERLRDLASQSTRFTTIDLLQEAAAEIVRLRGEVEEAKEGEAACLRGILFYEQELIGAAAPEPSSVVRERFRAAIANSESLWRSPVTLSDEQFQEVLSRVLDAHATLITTPPAAQVHQEANSEKENTSD